MNSSERNGAEKTSAAPGRRACDVTVRQRERMTVTGVEELISFDDGTVVMSTPLGTLSVDGSGLNVTRLDPDGKEITITGCIVGMYYTDPRKRGGKRLFGRG